MLLAMAGGMAVLAKCHSLFSWTALPTVRWLIMVCMMQQVVVM